MTVMATPVSAARAAFHTLTVASVEQLTEDSAAITFEVPEELREAYAFGAGQSLTLRRMIDGQDHRRTYSICAAVGERPRIGVREIPDGLFSHWLVHDVRPGDRIEVQTPTGSFRADPDAGGRHLCIAAGSGITPMISIVSSMLRHSDAEVTMLYGNRTSQSVMFAEELADLKNLYGPRFDLVHVLSREPRDVELFSGRLEADRLRRLLTALVPVGGSRPRMAVRSVRPDRRRPQGPRGARRRARQGALRAVLRRRAAAGAAPRRQGRLGHHERRDDRARRAYDDGADVTRPERARRRGRDAQRPAVRLQGRGVRHLPGQGHRRARSRCGATMPSRTPRSRPASC